MSDAAIRARLDGMVHEKGRGPGDCGDAVRAVLDTIQHWGDPNCDHRDDPALDYCVCGRGQLLAKIANALGVKA